MALTDTQKAQCRLYLGYPDQFRYRHTRLESVLDSVSPEAEVQIASALTSLAAVETQITDVTLKNAGLKRVDEIWFDTGSSGSKMLNANRNLGRIYTARLSIILGVPIYSDVFGSTGYLGDSFFPGFGEHGGGGFYNIG